METTITIIVDNKAKEGLASEHGLSMWIETGDTRIVFDTGQGSALGSNVRSLGIDISTADALVLSHGHYDHTGGIPYVFEQAPALDVYCHPEAVLTRYAIRDGKVRSIGIPQGPREALDAHPRDRVHWVQGPVMLSDTVGLTGPVPRLTGYEDTGGPFFLDPEGTLPDPIDDDQAIWIQTSQGLVVCVGCAHAGVVNTIRYIGKLTSGARIRAVVGGFHLMSAGRERLDQTVLALREVAPDLLAPCHCTGDSATALLVATLGDWVSPGLAGTVYRF